MWPALVRPSPIPVISPSSISAQISRKATSWRKDFLFKSGPLHWQCWTLFFKGYLTWSRVLVCFQHWRANALDLSWGHSLLVTSSWVWSPSDVVLSSLVDSPHVIHCFGFCCFALHPRTALDFIFHIHGFCVVTSLDFYQLGSCLAVVIATCSLFVVIHHHHL